MFKKNRINIMINTFVKVLSLILMINIIIPNTGIIAQASVSSTLGDNTTFLIEEHLATKQLIVVVYDRETGLPIGQIRVELYYEDSEYPITGSNGQYLTDDEGYVDFELSTLTMGNIYHIEIDTPGYYPYIGEDFELTGDMNIVIYLDPLPEVEEPEVEEPEEEPEIEPEPLPESEQKPLPEDSKEPNNDQPKTGDDTDIMQYLLVGVVALFFIMLVLIKKRNEDEE